MYEHRTVVKKEYSKPNFLTHTIFKLHCIIHLLYCFICIFMFVFCPCSEILIYNGNIWRPAFKFWHS